MYRNELIKCRNNYDFLSGPQRATIDSLLQRYKEADRAMETAERLIDTDFERGEKHYWYAVDLTSAVNRDAKAFIDSCGYFETIAYRNTLPMVAVFNS